MVPRQLDSNSAYMLGMIYGKGQILISEEEGTCRLEFKMKYRRPSVDALRSDNINVMIVPESSQPIEVAVFHEFQDLRTSFENILGAQVTMRIPNGSTRDGWSMKTLKLTSEEIPVTNRNLRELFNVNRITHETLQRIPEYFLSGNISSQFVLSFIQGFCDSCALPPSEVSAHRGGRGEQRLQVEPNWRRWHVPVEVARLFQEKLNIPVAMINFGHPQIRGLNSYRGQNHQLRVYIREIHHQIFRLSFKQDAFEVLYQRVVQNPPSIDTSIFLPGNEQIRVGLRRNNTNTSLNDPDLPDELRGIELDESQHNKNLQILALLNPGFCPNINIEWRQ